MTCQPAPVAKPTCCHPSALVFFTLTRLTTLLAGFHREQNQRRCLGLRRARRKPAPSCGRGAIDGVVWQGLRICR